MVIHNLFFGDRIDNTIRHLRLCPLLRMSLILVRTISKEFRADNSPPTYQWPALQPLSHHTHTFHPATRARSPFALLQLLKRDLTRPPATAPILRCGGNHRHIPSRRRHSRIPPLLSSLRCLWTTCPRLSGRRSVIGHDLKISPPSLISTSSSASPSCTSATPGLGYMNNVQNWTTHRIFLVTDDCTLMIYHAKLNLIFLIFPQKNRFPLSSECNDQSTMNIWHRWRIYFGHQRYDSYCTSFHHFFLLITMCFCMNNMSPRLSCDRGLDRHPKIHPSSPSPFGSYFDQNEIAQTVTRKDIEWAIFEVFFWIFELHDWIHVETYQLFQWKVIFLIDNLK